MNALLEMFPFRLFHRNLFLLVLTAFYSFVLISAGSNKLHSAMGMQFFFTGQGYPLWFMYFVGLSEVFGALSLWLTRWAPWGALGLMVIMIGASATHLSRGDPLSVAFMAYSMVPGFAYIAWCHLRSRGLLDWPTGASRGPAG